MAGFRLTNGTAGCPPTADPPAGYTIPFRFDSGGRLWITGAFPSFKYEKMVKHTVDTATVFGPSYGVPNFGWVTAGTNPPQTITNNTTNTLAYVLAYDLTVDFDVMGTSLAGITLFASWAGTDQTSTVGVTSVRTNYAAICRTSQSATSSPHEDTVDAGGTNILTLAPGASATVSAKLFSGFVEGTPNGYDMIRSASGKVRVYSYIP
jgi:hypothetical protein